MVKILGVCGSPRKGSTEYVLDLALQAAAEIPGVSTEMVTLRGKKLNFCVHCNSCVNKGLDYCPVYDDDMRQLYQKFYEADAYLFASPVYSMGITAQMTTFFNRFRPTYTIMKNNPAYFARKVGGAITVGGTRNGGQETALNVILGFYYTHGIVVASGGLGVYHGASVWSKDRKEEGVKEDLIGLNNAKIIAQNVARTALIMKG